MNANQINNTLQAVPNRAGAAFYHACPKGEEDCRWAVDGGLGRRATLGGCDGYLSITGFDNELIAFVVDLTPNTPQIMLEATLNSLCAWLFA